MFTQATPAFSGPRSGLGIGLALAREIIELHDGTIEAFSAGTGAGSRFSVRLPRLPDTSEPAAIESTAPRIVNQFRVLVVDDSKDNADTLAALLTHLEHDVEVAYGGQAALITAEKFQPHVVFMDIGMPELDGLQACRKMRAEPWGKTIFIVALTGWGNADDLRRTAEAGFNAHLIKPADFGELLRLLATIPPVSANLI